MTRERERNGKTHMGGPSGICALGTWRDPPPPSKKPDLTTQITTDVVLSLSGCSHAAIPRSVPGCSWPSGQSLTDKRKCQRRKRKGQLFTFHHWPIFVQLLIVHKLFSCNSIWEISISVLQQSFWTVPTLFPALCTSDPFSSRNCSDLRSSSSLRMSSSSFTHRRCYGKLHISTATLGLDPRPLSPPDLRPPLPDGRRSDGDEAWDLGCSNPPFPQVS